MAEYYVIYNGVIDNG